ncbi:MAG: type VII toxin-antitoxin system MntA family adenylyltransferase antitoxin [Candidatus Njordarchaeia archaeon]
MGSGEDLGKVVDEILRIGGKKVLFILLYGSRAEGYSRQDSDYDIAVYYEGDEQERYKFIINVLETLGEKFDVKTFQDLPLVLRVKALRDGKLLYYRDWNELFKIANRTRMEYEDFKHRLDLVLR